MSRSHVLIGLLKASSDPRATIKTANAVAEGIGKGIKYTFDAAGNAGAGLAKGLGANENLGRLAGYGAVAGTGLYAGKKIHRKGQELAYEAGMYG